MEYTKMPMCILSLDFREAFDNISHDYLFKMLEIYGFSNRFQRCIQEMYGNATSAVHVNGCRSGNFTIKCSVRQGCPLSTQLFALCIDPLLCAIDETLKGIRIGRGDNRTAVIAYADDITLLLTSPDDVPKLQDILDKYTSASGARINIHKSKAMAVGKWDTSTTLMGIPCYEHMKILGIHLTPL
jgi:hypothetical protein